MLSCRSVLCNCILFEVNDLLRAISKSYILKHGFDKITVPASFRSSLLPLHFLSHSLAASDLLQGVFGTFPLATVFINQALKGGNQHAQWILGTAFCDVSGEFLPVTHMSFSC